MSTKDLICKFCGAVFTLTLKNANARIKKRGEDVCCSKSCGQQLSWSKKEKKQPKPCIICGEPLGRGSLKYCSNICNGIGSRNSLEEATEKFWSRVDKTPGLGDSVEYPDCWEIRGVGRPHIDLEGKKVIGAVFAYKLEFGFDSIPKKMYVLHHCDNKYCVRVDHLFLGTAKENYDDMASKGRDNYIRKTSPHFKINREIAKKIRDEFVGIEKNTFEFGETLAKTAEKYKLCKSSIYRILNYSDWCPIKEHIQSLRKNGYCVIKSVYSDVEVATALDKVKFWYDSAPNILDVSYSIPRLNRNCPNVYNLHIKDKWFIDLLLKSEDIEKILIKFLNDIYYKAIPQDKPNYTLRAFGARSSKEALPPHIDSFYPFKGNDGAIVMQMVIMLEPSTIESGCTLVRPGSHLSGKYAEDDGKYIPVEAEPGDVIIWDSRLWHSTTENTTNNTRWALVATFARWFIKPMFDCLKDIPKDLYSQLTNKQKQQLGFCCRPPIGEYEFIDMKRGYEIFEND